MAFSLICCFGLVSVLVYTSYVHGYQPLEPNNADYLHNLSTWFRHDDVLPNIKGRSYKWKQFGVLTMGNISKDMLQPQPLRFNITSGNYAAFTPNRVTRNKQIHSEDQLEKAFHGMKRRFPAVKDIFIFSHWSPCNDCAQILKKLARRNEQLNFHIGYNCTYEKKMVPTIDNTRKILEDTQNIFFGDVCHHNSQSSARAKRDICGRCELGKLLTLVLRGGWGWGWGLGVATPL